MTVTIRDGVVQFVWDDRLADLMTLGAGVVTRASHVEPADAGGWTADMGPVEGPVLGPFALRQQALDAERSWLTSERGL